MRFATDRFFCVFALAAMCGFMVCPLTARAGFDFDGTPYSQDFDSLAATGTDIAWSNDETIVGWHLFNLDGSEVPNYDTGTGSSNAGGIYSFGVEATNSVEDRALGALGSVSFLGGWIGASFHNVITSMTSYSAVEIKYDGEQWRRGASNTNQNTMVMEYGFGAEFADVDWEPTGFDFVSPQTTTGTTLDGNATANRTPDIGGTILGLDWSPGETLWFRWIEVDNTGNDHALAIDNFRFSATAAVVPELSNLYTCSGLIGALGLYGLATTLVKRRRAAHATDI